MKLNAIYTIIKLIYRQNISKIIYVIFTIITPILIVLTIFFYFYMGNTISQYESLLKKSFFGYYPYASLLFYAKDKETDKIAHKISRKLMKKDISNTVVYTYQVGNRFKLIDNHNRKIDKRATLLIYQDNYFHKKFGAKTDIVLTTTLYEPLLNQDKIFLASKTGKISILENYKIIDVGFLNVTSTIILSKEKFKQLHDKIYPSRIDISSKNMDIVSKVVKSIYRHIFDIPQPKIKIYSKELLHSQQLFTNLKILKLAVVSILLMMIFFLFMAIANAIKELKEREFEIVKNLGFKTIEIVSSFLIVETIVILLAFTIAFILYMCFLNSFDILSVIANNINNLRYLSFYFLLILFSSTLYLWSIFHHDTFN